MKHRLKIIAAALALAMSAAQAQDLFSHNKPLEFEFLQEISASTTIGKHPIIPTGRPHRLLDLEEHDSTGLGSGLPLGFAWLADLEGDKAVALIYVWSNLSQNTHIGEPNSEPCKGENFIWKRSAKGKFSDVNCATIKYYAYPFLRTEGRLGDIVSKLRERKIQLPDEVIEIGLSRYMEQGRTLWFSIFLDPKALGQEYKDDKKWAPVEMYVGSYSDLASKDSPSEMLKSLRKMEQVSYTDPGKQAIIEHLKSWAEQAQTHMSQALFLKPDAFKGLPDLFPASKTVTPE